MLCFVPVGVIERVRMIQILHNGGMITVVVQ